MMNAHFVYSVRIYLNERIEFNDWRDECMKGKEKMASKKIPTHGRKSTLVFFRSFFSAFFGLMLIVLLVLTEFLLFVRALNDNIVLPSVWLINSETVTAFFDSWVSLLLCSILPLIPILILLRINSHNLRKVFLTIGCSSVISAAINIIIVISNTPAIKLLSVDWQNALVNTTSAFRDFLVVCAVFLIIIGATFISIYSCIIAIKGGRHEKAV